MKLFHKQQLAWVFFIQSFLPVGYAVISSSLIFMLPHTFNIDINTANKISGNFFALIYLLNLIGGTILKKYLSTVSIFFCSVFLQLLGFLLLLSSTFILFNIGLALFTMGFGFGIPCINILLIKLGNKESLEYVFMLNYCFIHVGYFIGFCLAGMFVPQNNFMLPLIICTVIYIFISIVIYFTLMERSANVDNNYIKAALVSCGALLVSLLFLKDADIANELMILIGIAGFAYLGYKAAHETEIKVRNKLWVFVCLSFCVLMFWSLTMIIPMGLMLFLAKNVELDLGWIYLTPHWIRNINIVLVVICSPPLSNWVKSINQNKVILDYSILFALGLFFTGLGFILLAYGVYLSPHKVHFIWILGFFILTTIGEIFLVPVSFAMIATLTTEAMRNFSNSFVMVLSGIAAAVASYLSNMLIFVHESDYLIDNHLFATAFLGYGIAPLVIAVLLWCASSKIKRIIL